MDTSPFAYIHTIHAAPSMPQAPSRRSETARMLNLYGPLFWLFRVLMTFTFGRTCETQPLDEPGPVLVSHGNRETRRYFKRRLSPVQEDALRRRTLVTRILSRGLTRAQYREKVARIFPGGRVRTYGIRFWGSRRLRRARLSCHDHGTWRSPVCSAMNSGMWDAQLPPN